MTIELLMGQNDDGRRADRIVRKALPDLPLSAIHRLFRAGKIRIRDRKLKADSRLCGGDTLSIEGCDEGMRSGSPSAVQNQTALPPGALPELGILFQNEDFVVINKEEGVLVHGRQSLEESVRALLADTLPPSQSFRPGPLHRLDQGTSGIIVFSASLEGARSFSKALHDHKMKKEYLALVGGTMERELCLEDRLERVEADRKTLPSPGGKEARTIASPIACRDGMSLIRAVIEGGRTHQIRAHLGAAGFPLVNDRKYAGPTRREVNGGRFLLHAHRLEQESDISLNLPQKLEAPLSPEFLRIITAVFGPETVRMMLY